jgi:hypothetical protein
VRPGFPLAGRPWWNPKHSLGVIQHHRGFSFLLSLNAVWEMMFLETIERGRADGPNLTCGLPRSIITFAVKAHDRAIDR